MDLSPYEAPSIRVIGSVASLTQFGGDNCFLGKTMPADKDWVGYVLRLPVGNCPAPTNGS